MLVFYIGCISNAKMQHSKLISVHIHKASRDFCHTTVNLRSQV